MKVGQHPTQEPNAPATCLHVVSDCSEAYPHRVTSKWYMALSCWTSFFSCCKQQAGLLHAPVENLP